MIFKKWMLTVATVLLFSSQAHANIMVQLFSADCDHVIGSWTGIGEAKTKLIACEYTGDGQVSGSPASFVMDVKLKKKSGIFCPESESFSLSGQCINNVLTLRTDMASLNGHLTAGGSQADLTGYVKFSILGKIIKADTVMHLQKK